MTIGVNAAIDVISIGEGIVFRNAAIVVDAMDLAPGHGQILNALVPAF